MVQNLYIWKKNYEKLKNLCKNKGAKEIPANLNSLDKAENQIKVFEARYTTLIEFLIIPEWTISTSYKLQRRRKGKIEQKQWEEMIKLLPFDSEDTKNKHHLSKL